MRRSFGWNHYFVKFLRVSFREKQHAFLTLCEQIIFWLVVKWNRTHKKQARKPAVRWIWPIYLLKGVSCMSQQHSNTKKRSFQHLTPYQRGQIQALIEQRISKVHIAKQVGIARSTLYEELKRGTVDQMRSDLTYYKRYFADTRQLVYMTGVLPETTEVS